MCQRVFSSVSNASNCTHKGFSIHIMTSAQHIMGQPIRHCLQGQCSKDGCMYSHKELPASSGVCRAYAAGFCPKGQACTQEHLTPKMLRELRASRTLRAGNAKVRVSDTLDACELITFTASLCYCLVICTAELISYSVQDWDEAGSNLQEPGKQQWTGPS